MTNLPTIPDLKALTGDELFVVEHMTLKWMLGKGTQDTTQSGFRLFCRTARQSGKLNKRANCDLSRGRATENKAAYATYLKNVPATGTKNRLDMLLQTYAALDGWSKLAMARSAQRGYILQAKKKGGSLTRGCFIGLKIEEIKELYQYYGLTVPSAKANSRVALCVDLTEQLHDILRPSEMTQLLKFLSGSNEIIRAPSKPSGPAGGPPKSRLRRMYEGTVLPRSADTSRFTWDTAHTAFGKGDPGELSVTNWGNVSSTEPLANTVQSLKDFGKKWVANDGSFVREGSRRR